MPIVNGLTVTLGDLVEETTQTTGAGTYALDGAPTGRRTFVTGIGSGTRTIYKAETASGTPYEIGIGTVTSGAPATISRDSILLSSNANLAVSWGPGSKRIFCDLSAVLANQIWSKPSAGFSMGAVETRGPFSFSGSQSVFEAFSIATTAKIIHFGWSNIVRSADVSELLLQLGDSGGVEFSGYASTVQGINHIGQSASVSSTIGFLLAQSGGTPPMQQFGTATLCSLGANFWSYHASCSNFTSGATSSSSSSGAKALSGTLDRIRFANQSVINFAAGGTIVLQIIHGV